MENFNKRQVQLSELILRICKCQDIQLKHGYKWAAEEQTILRCSITEIIREMPDEQLEVVLDYVNIKLDH